MHLLVWKCMYSLLYGFSPESISKYSYPSSHAIHTLNRVIIALISCQVPGKFDRKCKTKKIEKKSRQKEKVKKN